MANILITGASGGLGGHLAYKLCECDNKVILGYYKNKENVLKLQNKFPTKVIPVALDVTNEENIKRVHELLVNKNIKIDTLINNAGIDITGDLDSKSMDSFINIYKVNTIGVFLMIREFLNDLISTNGHIVNISSDNTIDKYDMVSLEYDISKCGVNQITKTFAREYSNIYVNALLFGWLDTPMNDIPDDIKEMLDFVSLEDAVQKIIEYMKTEKTGELELVRK